MTCIKNEKKVFTQKAVQDLLLKYELVQLYTNRNDEKLQAEADKNQKLMVERFRNTPLPLYVILDPTQDGYREIARINGELKEDAFRAFLSIPKTMDRIDIEAFVVPSEVKPGQTAQLTVRAKPKPGFYTYPITQRAPKQPVGQLTVLTILDTDDIKPLWPIREPEPEWAFEQSVGAYLKYTKPVDWTQDIYISEIATPGDSPIPFSLKIQVCDSSCLTGTHYFTIPIKIKNEKSEAPSPQLKERLDEKQPPITIVPVPDGVQTSGGKSAAGTGAKETGLLAFMLQGVFWGAVSLVTPCVFPMIPITVSFFLKQSEKEGHRPILSATVYSLTIVIVLTFAAVALLSVFRTTINHWITQFIMGGLFIFFALSLFGMYEIELPSGLAQFTSQREGSSLIGTIFMALTFTILSFACVAPFLGGFGGTAATAEMGFGKMLMGGLAFSVTFASPFMLLALFPPLLKKMPKSGSWLNSVKVVMGFIEIAAALKFLRAGERLLTSNQANFLTFNLVLALYIGICAFIALYLLALYRLPHDSPTENIGVPRMLMGLTFLGLAFYLTPAMFQANEKGNTQRPRGSIFAWVSSFILSDNEYQDWKPTLEEGLAEARNKPGSRIFIDFTGVNCTNCNINEENIFPMPEVQEQLQRYVRVKLYTDVVPAKFYRGPDRSNTAKHEEDAANNLKLQREKFETEQLPLYAIIEPTADGWKTIAVYDEGKINNVARFLDFLRDNAPDGR